MKYKVDDAIYDSIDDVLNENVDEEYHWDDEYCGPQPCDARLCTQEKVCILRTETGF